MTKASSKNTKPPRGRRMLLQAMGVGTSVALFGCSSSSAGLSITDADLSHDDAHSGDAEVVGFGTAVTDAGPVMFDSSGTNIADAGPSPEEASSTGTLIADAGTSSDAGHVFGTAPIDAGNDGDGS